MLHKILEIQALRDKAGEGYCRRKYTELEEVVYYNLVIMRFRLLLISLVSRCGDAASSSHRQLQEEGFLKS